MELHEPLKDDQRLSFRHKDKYSFIKLLNNYERWDYFHFLKKQGQTY